jgi:hypothetical protein
VEPLRLYPVRGRRAHRLEIAQRARLGLQKREVILPETIETSVDHVDDAFRLYCSFQFAGESEPRQLNVVIDRSMWRW